MSPVSLAVALLILFALPLGIRSAKAASVINPPQTVWLVEGDQLSSEEKLALYCLQGIANRKGPRVFMKQGASCRWMDFEYHHPKSKGGPVWNPATVENFEKKYPYIGDYWIDYFTGKGDFVFKTATLPELIGNLGSEIKGSILFEAIKTDISPVATMAGLENAIPLTPALEAKFAAQGVKLPVVFDYRSVRSTFLKGSDARLEGHRWAMDHLLSRCSKDGAISRDRTYGSDLHDSITDVDLGVMKRWLVYDLNHLAAENDTALTISPNPVDVALLYSLFNRLLPTPPGTGEAAGTNTPPAATATLTDREKDSLWKILSKITPPSPDPKQKALLHGLLTQIIIGTPNPSQKELLDKLSPNPAAAPTAAITDDDKVILDKLIARITPVPPNPEEQDLLEEMLSQITPFSPVYGWGRPEEANFIRSLNRMKLVGICSSVPNNSFFAALPKPISSTFKQKGNPCEETSLVVEPKVYVAFMVNEGDSLKIANGLMGDGAWIQPERGTIPINWGVDPLLIRDFPALMNYYYATMTEKDYFFAASSGWGYTHPSFLPQDALMPYADLVKQGGELADVRYVDIWHINSLKKTGSYYPFLKATGMKGLTDWDNSQQSVEYTDFSMTIIKGNQYYTLGDPAKFADMLVSDMKGVKAPWFIIVYGARGHGTPYKFAEVAKRLPAEQFKVVKLDEFFAAATKAKAEVQGRVWRPGPNAPKGVAP